MNASEPGTYGQSDFCLLFLYHESTDEKVKLTTGIGHDLAFGSKAVTFYFDPDRKINMHSNIMKVKNILNKKTAPLTTNQ